MKDGETMSFLEDYESSNIMIALFLAALYLSELPNSTHLICEGKNILLPFHKILIRVSIYLIVIGADFFCFVIFHDPDPVS